MIPKLTQMIAKVAKKIQKIRMSENDFSQFSQRMSEGSGALVMLGILPLNMTILLPAVH